MPAGLERMYAIATRPVAGSIPIAGRTASRPRVTAIGALHCAPSAEVATNAALLDAPGDAQSCHAAQKRPVGSTSADGSGNARKSRIAQPSVDRRDAHRRTPGRASVRRARRCDPELSGLQEVDDDEIAVRADRRKDTDPTADAEVDRERPREAAVVRPG